MRDSQRFTDFQPPQDIARATPAGAGWGPLERDSLLARTLPSGQPDADPKNFQNREGGRALSDQPPLTIVRPSAGRSAFVHLKSSFGALTDAAKTMHRFRDRLRRAIFADRPVVEHGTRADFAGLGLVSAGGRARARSGDDGLAVQICVSTRWTSASLLDGPVAVRQRGRLMRTIV